MFDETFWVAASFVLFLALAGRWLFRTITKALDERGARIRTEIEEAVRLREEAQNLLARYQRRQREAAQEAEAIVARAREEAETIRAAGRRDLERQIARRGQLAEEKIAQTEARAVKDLRDTTVDLAVAATARAIEDRLDDARHDALITHGIEQARSRLH